MLYGTFATLVDPPKGFVLTEEHLRIALVILFHISVVEAMATPAGALNE